MNFLPIFILFLGVTAVEFVDTFATKNDYTLNACCIGKQADKRGPPPNCRISPIFSRFFSNDGFLDNVFCQA